MERKPNRPIRAMIWSRSAQRTRAIDSHAFSLESQYFSFTTEDLEHFEKVASAAGQPALTFHVFYDSS